MSTGDDKLAEILATMGRLERAQERFATIAGDMLTALEVHTEKLDAILLAATSDPGPSPTAAALKQLVAAVTEQTVAVCALPDALAHTIRSELAREIEETVEAEGDEGWEPAEPH